MPLLTSPHLSFGLPSFWCQFIFLVLISTFSSVFLYVCSNSVIFSIMFATTVLIFLVLISTFASVFLYVCSNSVIFSIMFATTVLILIFYIFILRIVLIPIVVAQVSVQYTTTCLTSLSHANVLIPMRALLSHMTRVVFHRF